MKEFRTCPQCGYKHGFHIFFKETEGKLTIGLICPNCAQSYEPDWIVNNVTNPFAPKESKRF